MLSDLLSGTYLTLSVIAHQFLKTTQTAAPVSLLVLSLYLYVGVQPEMQTLVERRIYPFLLMVFILLAILSFQIRQFKRLYEHIKNDKWVVVILFFFFFCTGGARCSSRIQRKSSSGTLVWKHDSIYVCQILTGKRFGQGHVWIHWCVFTLWSVKLISNSEGESREVWATQKFIFQEDNF